MLNVLANSFMIATRTQSSRGYHEVVRLLDGETARQRRSRDIAAFVAASRHATDRHLNA